MFAGAVFRQAGGVTERSTAEQAANPGEESLASLLGGRRAAIDATLPPVAFVAGWLAFGDSVLLGAISAVLVGAVLAVVRQRRGDKPRAVLLGMLGVVLAALVPLYTGRASDFFLLQLIANAGSALAWAVSIVIRWPLLGVVVGTALGQRTRWRKDPALLRAYSLASWSWVMQYVIRLAVFIPLWWIDATVALGTTRAALTYPLVALNLAVSWWIFRKALPADHPGIRHPRVP
ncbi:Protein of unknown function [Allokutzneria albata]|uniref:Intracellular septation protein A n=1 Tax=Allokutzneria albata TaxID=211114 RepID=A0A1H0ART6_ALLAB|nr:Protein of unknown function [Allokutzneria albata]